MQPFSLLLVLAMTGLSADAGTGLPDTSQMNILFIDIEDCNANVWGCYGNPVCKTPNMDRFAATAVRFDSAYCQAICCNPTRTSFLTGLRPLSTHVLGNGHVMNEHLPAGVLTLPENAQEPRHLHRRDWQTVSSAGLRRTAVGHV